MTFIKLLYRVKQFLTQGLPARNAFEEIQLKNRIVFYFGHTKTSHSEISQTIPWAAKIVGLFGKHLPELICGDVVLSCVVVSAI